MSSTRPLLFERWPRLARTLSFVPLGAFPTPVHALSRLSVVSGADLFVKRDDLSSPLYGGNKVRKLEWLLAEALARGARAVLTFGAAGSNHVVATALHARRLGLATAAVLVPQPAHAYVAANRQAARAAGARLVDVAGGTALPRAVFRTWCALRDETGRPPYVIAPGGSSPLGVLGYVEAALELAADVAAGRLPTPDLVFVAAGTCGTLAGLSLGLRLAGLPTHAVGVGVYPWPATSAPVATWQARRALDLLRRADPRVPDVTLCGADVRLDGRQLGGGYAHYTTAGDEAVRHASELEGLHLEGTYTGKALAAMLAFAETPAGRGRPLLFVDTYNSAPLDLGCAD